MGLGLTKIVDDRGVSEPEVRATEIIYRTEKKIFKNLTKPNVEQHLKY